METPSLKHEKLFDSEKGLLEDEHTLKNLPCAQLSAQLKSVLELGCLHQCSPLV